MEQNQLVDNWSLELNELVKRFVGGLDSRMTELRKEVDLENWEQVGALAHKIKGAASSYGFTELANAAKDLESSIQSHKHFEVPILMSRVASSISHSKSMHFL